MRWFPRLIAQGVSKISSSVRRIGTGVAAFVRTEWKRMPARLRLAKSRCRIAGSRCKSALHAGRRRIRLGLQQAKMFVRRTRVRIQAKYRHPLVIVCFRIPVSVVLLVIGCVHLVEALRDLADLWNYLMATASVVDLVVVSMELGAIAKSASLGGRFVRWMLRFQSRVALRILLAASFMVLMNYPGSDRDVGREGALLGRTLPSN